MDLLLTGGRLFDSEVNIGILSGKISYIGCDRPKAECEYDLDGLIVLPGMIDPHVHMRDLGQSDKEDWLSGSKAALAGGVTSLIDMPNTQPPTNDVKSLNMKIEAAQRSLVNYGFHVGVSPGNLKDLDDVLKNNLSVIAGVKVFLAETSSNEVIESVESVEQILKISAACSRPVLFHHELFSSLRENLLKYQDDRYNDISFHDSIRSRSCEEDGIELIIRAAENTSAAVYICHVSTRSGFEMISEAKKRGVNIIAEATPHHLFLNYNVSRKAGNFAKINPPLRSEADRSFLYNALRSDLFDIIGSDHAPHQIELKQKSYKDAPSGFPGLETSLPLLIDRVLNRELSFEQVAALTAEAPAKYFGIKERGYLREGYFADFVIVDPSKNWQVDPESFFSKAHYSPFQDTVLKGKIVQTWVNGKQAYCEGRVVADVPGKQLEFCNKAN